MYKFYQENRMYIISVAVLIVIILLAFFSPEKRLFIVDKPVYELNGEWTVTNGMQQKIQTQLPYHVSNRNKTPDFKASIRLPEDFPEGMSIRIRASMQDITVAIDGNTFFENKRKPSKGLVYPEVSMWHIIPLPKESGGKELSIRYTSRVRTFQGTYNAVYYGTGDALVQDILADKIIGLIIAAFMMMLGVIAIIASIFMKRMGDYRLYYLGIYSITSSMWMISEMRLLQWITGNRFILGGISYLCIAIFPVALLKYLESVVLGAYERMIRIFVRLYYILFWGNLFLQVTGLVPFIYSAVVVNGLMAIAIIWVGMTLLYEAIKKNTMAKRYLLYYSVLLVTGLIEIIFFFYKDFDMLTRFDKVGFAVFLFFQFMESILYFKNLLLIENEAVYLEQMAYQDALTKGKNRAAYEKELDRLLSQSNHESFRLILVDINELKYINDNYGHNEGDVSIIACYDCLIVAFGEMGSCYRLGGDEFACLLTDTDTKRYDEALEHFKKLIKEMDERFEFPFHVAIGQRIYDRKNQEEKFGDFFHHVDGMMYDMKKKMKVE